MSTMIKSLIYVMIVAALATLKSVFKTVSVICVKTLFVMNAMIGALKHVKLAFKLLCLVPFQEASANVPKG